MGNELLQSLWLQRLPKNTHIMLSRETLAATAIKLNVPTSDRWQGILRHVKPGGLAVVGGGSANSRRFLIGKDSQCFAFKK